MFLGIAVSARVRVSCGLRVELQPCTNAASIIRGMSLSQKENVTIFCCNCSDKPHA